MSDVGCDSHAKKALVVAGGLPQIELINQLKSRGIESVLVDGAPCSLAFPYADKFYQVDVFDIASVRDIAVKEKVDFLITVCADQVLLVVAEVSEQLGLPCYVDLSTCEKASNKIEMKKVFFKNGIPTSKYLESAEYSPENFSSLSFPLVVKPVDAYSSKGVRKARTSAELESFYQEAQSISQSGSVIVEEYCEGTEISVDAFVVHGVAKILCVSESEKVQDNDRFVIFRGIAPAQISDSLYQRVAEVCQLIADAFGIVDSPLLVQMIAGQDDVSVLEFCTRTGGCMKYLLIKYSSGVDVIGATIDLSLGLRPDLSAKIQPSPYVMNDFIYCSPGTFDHLEGFEELVEQGVLQEFHCIRPKGFVARGVTSSSDRVAGVTICGKTVSELAEKQRLFAQAARVIDTKGADIMRHDLFPGLSSYSKEAEHE